MKDDEGFIRLRLIGFKGQDIPFQIGVPMFGIDFGHKTQLPQPTPEQKSVVADGITDSHTDTNLMQN
jgi:hypothetical protein